MQALWLEAVFSRLADAVVGIMVFERYALYREDEQMEAEVAIRYRRIMDPLWQIYELTMQDEDISRLVDEEMFERFLVWILLAISYQADRRAERLWKHEDRIGRRLLNPGYVYRYLIERIWAEERVQADQQFHRMLLKAEERLQGSMPYIRDAYGGDRGNEQ